MQFNAYICSIFVSEKKTWGEEHCGGVNTGIWDCGGAGGGGVVEQLNCWAWVSNLAWTPGSAYCLVEAAGETFGPESKTWLLLGRAFQLAPISLESPFQLVETERSPRAPEASINSLQCPRMQSGGGGCLN